MNKKNIFWISLISIVAFIGFGSFEITARFFDDMDRYVVTKEFDPLLGWRLKPGHHSVRPSGRLAAIPLEINSYGLRGEEFPAAAQNGEKRMMVLGDSFVFSRHFMIEETFTGRLEKILNADVKQHTRVINAGVPGYGTGQELLFMKKLAEENKIIPNAYILMIFPNDILDNLSLSYGSYDSVAVKPRFELETSGKAVLKHLPVNDLGSLQESFRHPDQNNPWKLHSVEFIKESVAGFFESHPKVLETLLHWGAKPNLPRKPGLLNGWYDDRVVNEGLPLMKALMGEMKEEAAKHGASFKVVMVPSPVQIYPGVYKKILTRQFPGAPDVEGWIADPMKAQRMLGSICEELGLEFLDLFPILEKNSQKLLYIPRDGHFDRAAHEIVADALAKWITSSESKQNSSLFVHPQGTAK